MMSDQCKNCTARGDFKLCQETPCWHHENWINLQRIKLIDQLRADLKESRNANEGWAASWGNQKARAEKAEAQNKELEADLAQATSAVDDLMAGNDKLQKLIDQSFEREQTMLKQIKVLRRDVALVRSAMNSETQEHWDGCAMEDILTKALKDTS